MGTDEAYERIDPRGIIDHLVYGVLDLPQAVERIEQQIGVRPAHGGRHLGRGTSNYLLALSDTAYLEVIGIDPTAELAEGQSVPFGLDRLTDDRIITWAIHPHDLDGVLVKARRHGVDYGKLHAMSRVDEHGTELHWTLAYNDELPFDGLAPFLIDWADSPRPASSGIPRARLTELSLTTPEPQPLNALLEDIRLAQRADAGEPAIRATIEGPTGKVTL